MKSTILSGKDYKLIEKAILQYGRILNIHDLMSIFQGDYSKASAHNRINLLVRSGWFRRIKQGLYLIIDSLTARSGVDVSLLSIANALVENSYVSLAQALNYYQLFDQYSATVVSVTISNSKKYLFDSYTFKYSKIKQDMYDALTKLDNGMPKNDKVRISNRGNGWITVSPSEAQPEPVNLSRLKAEVSRLWPMTSLLDVLKEIIPFLI